MPFDRVASIDTFGEREYDKRRSIHLSGSYSLPNINHTAGSDQPLTKGITMNDEPLDQYDRTRALWKHVEKVNKNKKFDDRRLVYVAEENSHDVPEEEWLECAIGTVDMYVDGSIDDPWVLADE